MQTLGGVESISRLSEAQRAALASLLADEDPAVYKIVRGRILGYGRTALDWLRPYKLSQDPLLRRRALEIVTHHERLDADRRFLEYCSRHDGEELDLEEALLLLAQTRYPEINPEGYRALFDDWSCRVRQRLDPASSGDAILEALNRCLFEELGFIGNDRYPFEPDCCYLNRIVDRRAGNPLGLCAVYLFVARRLRLPVAGIGLPGHFICRYQSSRQETYIDCFRKGLLLTKASCMKYLVQNNFGLAESHLSPLSPRRMLQRMCKNLVLTYGHLEMTEEARRAQRYVAALCG